MNPLVRLCVVVTMLVTPLVRAADLQTAWTQRFAGAADRDFTVQVVRINSERDVIVAGTVSSGETGSDIWVAKLKAGSGTVRWVFRKDGGLNGPDKLGAIVCADNGDVFVAGALASELSDLGPLTDSYVARLGSDDGQPVWDSSDTFPIADDDAWHDLALDAAGNPVLTGVLNVQGLGSEVRTAKLNADTGATIWARTYHSFESDILDQGERVLVDAKGDVYVQGRHFAGSFADVNYPPAVQIVSYTADGTFRWGTRFREGANVSAFGFLPVSAGGFFVGVSVVGTQGNMPILTVARGNIDGTFSAERPISFIHALPNMALAENGDILVSGRVTAPNGEDTLVSAGRLAPGTLLPHWTESIVPPASGPSAAFAHISFVDDGSAVAGITPGGATADLVIATFKREGGLLDELYLDGSAGTFPVPDFPPSGPALAGDALGQLAVAIPTLNSGGQREVIVRSLRLFRPPAIALTFPTAATPPLRAGEAVTLTAAVQDSDGDPVSVEFFVNGASVGVVGAAPFELPHSFQTAGNSTVEAIATDATGQKASSGVVTVMVGVPTPVVVTGAAQRTGPAIGQFFGEASNLPFGGAASFRYTMVGGDGTVFTTANVNLPTGDAPQAVAIPFSIPVPHREYQYRLVVIASEGNQTATGTGAVMSFTIPNSPVVASPDFIFAPRGVITGQPLANDVDDDPGEQLTITVSDAALPGTLVIRPQGVAFNPAKTFTGETIFDYAVDDGHGSTATETIVLRSGRFYAGNYRALPPLDEPHVGVVDATVSALGRATVVGYLDGVRFATGAELRQLSDSEVGITVRLRRQGEPDKQLNISWGLDRSMTAVLQGDDTTFFIARGLPATPSPFPADQSYALRGTHTPISGNAGGRTTPFAYLRLPVDGRATFRGRLGDGTPFTTFARLQGDGVLPIYSPLKGRRTSFIVGSLIPGADGTTTAPAGMLAVQAAKTKKTPLYASDYRDAIDLAGPQFTPGTPLLNFVAEPRTMELRAEGGGFATTTFPIPIWMGKKGQLSGIIGITRLSVDSKTGEFSGAFLPPGQIRTLPFYGILRPDLNDGVGGFRGLAEAGHIEIVPQ